MDHTVSVLSRHHRDQLTALVNRHVAAVIPGITLSTNAVLSQLEREPDEVVVDPWVVERRTLVVESGQRLLAAALVHRCAPDEEVGHDYRDSAIVRWLVCEPGRADAGRALIAGIRRWARSWSAPRLLLDPALPAPGCYVIPDTWPHLVDLWDEAGATDPLRREQVLTADCADLVGHLQAGDRAQRSVGRLGTRLDVVGADGVPVGWVEVCDAGLVRSRTAASWADVGNLHGAAGELGAGSVGRLLGAAADWLQRGGVDRLLDYATVQDVADPQAALEGQRYAQRLQACGFRLLCTTGRGYAVPLQDSPTPPPDRAR
ncbi:N-acetyltransferase [Serinicoccus kebangsaanensis]|uniref:N-acetyltransferase n=1 Tax=Serinicoccus kebangsaanensis TaxID=2602069 RepID=UPI00124CC6EE|nr:N-acetyltransferase [Serinicoccus kebangsaanensis]